MKPAACVLAAVAALAGCGGPGPAVGPGTAVTTTPFSPVAPATARQIARQDDKPAGQRGYEEEAMADRPLLDHLPLTVGPVTISIAGLTSAGRVRLIVDAGDRSAREARDVYRDALKAYGDDGHAYRLEVRP